VFHHFFIGTIYTLVFKVSQVLFSRYSFGMKKISCLICAYNEGPRIGKVLEVATNHPLIDEVLVVDDGSTDNTAKVLRSFKNAKLIFMGKNQGKTKALLTGLSSAKNSWVLLLDADLKGLNASAVTELLTPVLEEKVDVSMSIRANSLAVMKWMGLDFVSGERVFDKTILSGHEKELQKLPRFGFEVFLNSLFIQKKLRLAAVSWPHVSHARKSEKMGWFKGQMEDLKMILNIFKTIGVRKIISQNRQLLKQLRGA
jgi:glycosyltransferase involved in cell wall biosynthesis